MTDEFVEQCICLGSKTSRVPFRKQEVMYRFKRYQSRLAKLQRLEQRERQQQQQQRDDDDDDDDDD